MEQKILERISQALSNLSERQKTVAQYILSHQEESAFMTSTQLAQASGVSEATVIRFANRMGYQRYADMQGALGALVRGKLSQIERLRRCGVTGSPGRLMQTAIRSMQTDMASIEKTLAGLREEDLSAVVSALAKARRLYVTGLHSEFGLACYFASTLSWIRAQVYLVGESHSPAFDAVSDMSPEDAMLVISFPPYPADTVRLAGAALQRGATVVAITDTHLSPLSRRADHALFACDEKLSYVDNSAPAQSLLSLLLTLLGNYDYEASSQSLSRKQEYWDEIGFYYKETD